MPQATLTSSAIKRKLSQQLGAKWKPGERLPPIRTLSRQLGAGQVNTFRAVRELAEEGWLVSGRRLGTFVAPDLDTARLAKLREANRNPRPLLGKRVCVIHSGPGEASPLHQSLRDPLMSRLAHHGADVRVEYFDRHSDHIPPVLSGADALVLVNPGWNRRVRFSDDKQQQAILILNTDVTVPVDSTNYDMVSVEQEHGGFLAGRFLREAGCTTGCYLGRKAKSSDTEYDQVSTARLIGFEEAWGRSLPGSSRLMCRWYTEDAAADVVQKFLALTPRPDAIFAASDELALGFIYGALGVGLEPRRDYSIVGFDGQVRGRELKCGPLSTIDAPLREMSLRGAEFLEDRLLNPGRPLRRLNLGPQLFAGNTVRMSPTSLPHLQEALQ
jgi:DNA-binding LacI/PurR family transcriptional regulator